MLLQYLNNFLLKWSKLRYMYFIVVCLIVNNRIHSQTNFLDSTILKVKSTPYSCTYKGNYYSYPDKIMKYSGDIFFNYLTSMLRVKHLSLEMDLVKSFDFTGYNLKSDTLFYDFKESPNALEDLIASFEFMPFLSHPEVIKQFLKTATQTKWVLNQNEAILYYEMHKPESDSDAVRSSEATFKYSRTSYRLIEYSTKVTMSYNGIVGVDSFRISYNYKELAQKAINDSINTFKPHSKKIIYQKNDIQNSTLTNFPSFKLTDFNNKLFDSNKIKSDYVLVEFWSIYCVPCLTNINELIKLRNHYKKEEIEIIAINDIDSLNQKLKDFVIARKINYTTLYNARKFGKLVDVTARPNTFIYDRKTKKIVYQKIGGWNGYSQHIIKIFDEIRNKSK